MRSLFCPVLMSAALAATGCSNLISVHPLDAENRAIFDPQLIGTWTDGKTETYVVRPDGPRAYSIALLDDHDGRTTQMRGLLFDVRGERVLDLSSQDTAPFNLACHAFLRLRAWPDRIELQFLDTPWLRARAAETGVALLTTGDKVVLLTGPTSQVRAFVEQYGLDGRALGEPQSLTRL